MAFGSTLSCTVQKYLNLHSFSAPEPFSNHNKSERSHQVISDKLSLKNCKLEESEDLCRVVSYFEYLLVSHIRQSRLGFVKLLHNLIQ